MELNETKRLLEVVARLRKECPWDKKQTTQSLAPYLLEETYEALEAIEAKDMSELEGEMGDVLLQVALHAEIANETKDFSFESIAKKLADKMIYRHPHVFGDVEADNADQVVANWKELKSKEKGNKRETVFDGIPSQLPALQRAQKISARAAGEGFDWPDTESVFAKVIEEVGELGAELNSSKDRQEDEIGDLLYAITSLARHLKIDSEGALRKSTKKFEERYLKMEEKIKADGKAIKKLDIDALEAYWQSIK